MKITTLALALAMLASPAAAQNFIDLSAGFTPDPYSTFVMPGGPDAASDFDPSCTGMVASNSDFVLTYNAGSFPLTIKVEGTSDTTLMIVTPAGNMVCDDDSAGNLDPRVTFPNPESGVYSIWVGSIGTAEPARLIITEIE